MTDNTPKEAIAYAETIELMPMCECSVDQLRIVQLNRFAKSLIKANKELIEQAMVTHPEPPKDHIWIKLGAWNACSLCGTIQRADGKNKPCRGPVSVKLRA